MTQRTVNLNVMLQVRATESLTAALDRAAAQKLTSRADYIRLAMLDRLQRDGIDVLRLAEAG
ncbi:hypothetical protein ACVIIW_006252 [Bradyrhizobium sp. USDA 4449]